MNNSKTQNAPCPFQWGDRVDHPHFGLGQIVSEPIAIVGPGYDRSIPGGYCIQPKKWRCQVKWDDKSRGEKDIMSDFLTLVDRPDAKGGAFWKNEFIKFSEPALRAREKTNSDLTNSYRPVSRDGLSKLIKSLEKEQEALKHLLEFLENDEAGNHP